MLTDTGRQIPTGIRREGKGISADLLTLEGQESFSTDLPALLEQEEEEWCGKRARQ